MKLDMSHLRRPLGMLSLSMLSVSLIIGTYRLSIFDELGTATFVLSAGTCGTLLAHLFETRYGTDSVSR